MQAAGVDEVHAEETIKPDASVSRLCSSYTHSAVFAEVRVDESLGQLRVTRVVDAICAGRILNPRPRAARSSAASCSASAWRREEAVDDPKLGRFMNRNLAEYRVPVCADISGSSKARALPWTRQGEPPWTGFS